MSWFGHVHWIMIRWSKPYVNVNRHLHDQQEVEKLDIQEDLRIMKTNNWTKCSQDPG
jgi:hypothetical protein